MRHFKLISAITGMTVAAITILIGISNVAEIRYGMGYTFADAFIAFFYSMGNFTVITISVLILVFGGLLTRDKRDKGFAITFLVFVSIMTAFQLDTANMLLLAFANIVAIVFISLYLGSIKRTWTRDGQKPDPTQPPTPTH